jgi:hypothetical protein
MTSDARMQWFGARGSQSLRYGLVFLLRGGGAATFTAFHACCARSLSRGNWLWQLASR